MKGGAAYSGKREDELTEIKVATWECAKNSVQECEELVAAMHASAAGKRKIRQIAARSTRGYLRKAAVFENAALNPRHDGG